MAIYKGTTKIAKSNAKALRKNLTEAEKLLWYRLRKKQLGVKFRRQVPIGQYIVDFYSVESRLIIELDGGQHAETKIYDDERIKFLENKGLTVIRYWNNQVLTETDAVIENISQYLQNGMYQSLPPAGEG